MAVDNNLYVVVHTASDYVSIEQLEKEFVSVQILKVSFIGKNMNYSDYPLLTKQACTWHARGDIVSQAMCRKWVEIAHGMTLHHPY
jgi:hypothetical protein